MFYIYGAFPFVLVLGASLDRNKAVFGTPSESFPYRRWPIPWPVEAAPFRERLGRAGRRHRRHPEFISKLCDKPARRFYKAKGSSCSPAKTDCQKKSVFCRRGANKINGRRALNLQEAMWTGLPDRRLCPTAARWENFGAPCHATSRQKKRPWDVLSQNDTIGSQICPQQRFL